MKEEKQKEENKKDERSRENQNRDYQKINYFLPDYDPDDDELTDTLGKYHIDPLRSTATEALSQDTLESFRESLKKSYSHRRRKFSDRLGKLVQSHEASTFFAVNNSLALRTFYKNLTGTAYQHMQRKAMREDGDPDTNDANEGTIVLRAEHHLAIMDMKVEDEVEDKVKDKVKDKVEDEVEDEDQGFIDLDPDAGDAEIDPFQDVVFNDRKEVSDERSGTSGASPTEGSLDPLKAFMESARRIFQETLVEYWILPVINMLDRRFDHYLISANILPARMYFLIRAATASDYVLRLWTGGDHQKHYTLVYHGFRQWNSLYHFMNTLHKLFVDESRRLQAKLSALQFNNLIIQLSHKIQFRQGLYASRSSKGHVILIDPLLEIRLEALRKPGKKHLKEIRRKMSAFLLGQSAISRFMGEALLNDRDRLMQQQLFIENDTDIIFVNEEKTHIMKGLRLHVTATTFGRFLQVFQDTWPLFEDYTKQDLAREAAYLVRKTSGMPVSAATLVNSFTSDDIKINRAIYDGLKQATASLEAWLRQYDAL